MNARHFTGDAVVGAGGDRYRAPGLYYEEAFESIERPLRDGAVPAFVGFAPSVGDDDGAPLYFTRWAQFEARFGRAAGTGHLHHAVRGFFENGGRRCVVVAVRDADHPAGRVAALTAPFDPDGIVEGLSDIDLVCVPDATSDAIGGSRSDMLAIQAAALNHCARLRDRFAILDSLLVGHDVGIGSDVRGIAEVADQWSSLPPRDGALYFPWLRVRSASGSSETRLVPPCGHVASVYARVDAREGAHKAPANEVLEGVVDLAVHVADGESADLNERGVNCVRSLPGRGIRVWGARTLSGEPAWCYVNVSRLFTSLTHWLKHGLDDLAFEANGPRLWANVRDRLAAYGLVMFESGALRGRTADEAFFVKCDAETNPFDTVDAGEVIAQIGLAALAPLEFIVVHVTRRASGATTAQPTTS